MLVRSGATITTTEYAILTADSGQAWMRIRMPLRVSTSCHYTGIYEIPRVGSRQYQQSGLGNIPAAAWEAVRFSWAVDHALNSGKWLNSLMAADGLRWKEGSRSRIQRVKASMVEPFTVLPVESRWKLDKGYDPFYGDIDFGYFSRNVVANGVFPAFMPSVRSRLGVEFMSNALSVIANLAYGHHGRRFI